MSRWQGRLQRKQRFLGRVVDIGAELFAMSAAIVRARMLAEDVGDAGGAGATVAAHGAEAIELADLFCRNARQRVDRLFRDLWRNEDAANYRAAQAVVDGRYEWLESGIIDPSGAGPLISEPAPDGVSAVDTETRAGATG